MNFFKFYAIIFFLIFSLISCNNERTRIYRLKVKEVEINRILKKIILKEKRDFNVKDLIIVLTLDKKKNRKDYEIRIGRIYEKGANMFLSEIKNPMGFFKYKNVLVVVFGNDDTELFFKKTNVKKYFSFLEKKTKSVLKEGEIPPPPVPFEPIVWIYSYNNGKIELIDSGRFGL